MNASFDSSLTGAESQFGRRLAARLNAGTRDLPHESAERLRAARVQALAHRKVAQQVRTAPVVVSTGGAAAALGGGWWTRIATIAPIVALVVGLVAVNMLQDEHRASETAEVDAALLTDDLPPAAYTDPGFLQFLKTDDATPR
jgi:hypothetical protein